MNLIKIIGGVLVCLGFAFRAVCVAYFKVREPQSAASRKAVRRFEAQKRRAFLIDALFIVIGFALIMGR